MKRALLIPPMLMACLAAIALSYAPPAETLATPAAYSDIIWRLNGTQFGGTPGEYDIRVTDIHTIAQHGSPPRTCIYYADAWFVVSVNGPLADWRTRWLVAVQSINPSARAPCAVMDLTGV